MTQRLHAGLRPRRGRRLLSRMRSKPKTSVDILNERDALRERVDALETTLAMIHVEVERTLRHGHMHVSALRLIDATIRDALLEGPPLSKTRPTLVSTERPRQAG